MKIDRWFAYWLAAGTLGLAAGTCAGSNPGYDPLLGIMLSDGEDMASTIPPSGCQVAQTYSASSSPAAMMVVLDKSASMAQGNKWQAAAQAIVQSTDQNVFDSMWLGLYASPSAATAAPMCLQVFGISQVSCGAPAFPQIDLAATNGLKSTAATGVRRQIKDWLNTNNPDTGLGDPSPLYVSIQTAMDSLRAWPQNGKRILMVITDGSISCNQLSNPVRAGYPDANGCTIDWENPQNIVSLLSQAQQDPNQPIESFIIGVPGSDTYDPTGSNYPPYRMRLALSAMAYAGSPSNVPNNCNGRAYTKSGADPTIPCHFDLTVGALSAASVANAIATARQKVASCTYDLPTVGGGKVPDKSQVNVSLYTNGQKSDLYRRKDTSNTCISDGCWDYNALGQVQLIGKACTDVQANSNTEVKVTIGCFTVIG